MKNSLVLKSLIGLMIILSVLDFANAADNFAITISCSIPAVPGLNAPPFKEATEAGAEMVSENPLEAKEDTQEPMPVRIQEDKKEEIQLADGKTLSLATQTIYSR